MKNIRAQLGEKEKDMNSGNMQITIQTIEKPEIRVCNSVILEYEFVEKDLKVNMDVNVEAFMNFIYQFSCRMEAGFWTIVPHFQ